LEQLPVLHPVDGELMWLDIGLVEDEDEGQSSLVQDPVYRRMKSDVNLVGADVPSSDVEHLRTSIQHVAHESARRCRPWCINHIRHAGRHRRSDGFGDDRSGSGPGEDLNLARSIQEDVTMTTGLVRRYHGRSARS